MRFEDNVNDLIGIVTGLLVFAGCWAAIVVVYGTQWGGALGWMPAAAAGVAARQFWPLAWLIAGLLYIFYGNVINFTVRQVYEQYFNHH